MDMFKAMADPTRRRILQLLSEKNLSAGEIAEEFTMSKPAISKHLDILKTSELITCEKQGQYVIYAINTSAVEQMYCRFLDVFDGMSFHGKAQKHENDRWMMLCLWRYSALRVCLTMASLYGMGNSAVLCPQCSSAVFCE